MIKAQDGENGRSYSFFSIHGNLDKKNKCHFYRTHKVKKKKPQAVSVHFNTGLSGVCFI